MVLFDGMHNPMRNEIQSLGVVSSIFKWAA